MALDKNSLSESLGDEDEAASSADTGEIEIHDDGAGAEGSDYDTRADRDEK